VGLSLSGLERSVRANVEWCLAVAEHYRVPVTVVSTYRTRAEQMRLRRNYEQCLASGRFGQGPDCLYPANKPGFSAHEYGLAWDSSVEPRYQAWWNYVRQTAGFHVLPGDLPHAEVPNWRDFVRLPRGVDD
jgi:hypothetical protein